MSKIKAIMAVDNQAGVGKNGSIPWPPNKEDLQFFRRMTTGNFIMMGSRTWDDEFFPGPLPSRQNIVISSRKASDFPGAYLVSNNPRTVLENLKNHGLYENIDCWVIGGPNLIKQVEDLIDEFYLTVINGDFECDKFLDFPFYNFDLEDISAVNAENKYYKYTRII